MLETGSTSREQEAARASLPCAVRLQTAVFSAAIDVINRRDGTVNRRLYSVADRILRVRACPRPDSSGVRSADFDVDASRGLWARVFSLYSPVAPAAQAPLPVVVYFHGGGFAMFSARQCYFDRLCRRICRRVGAVVVSVEYRLAPEHPYPAAYDDAVDTLRFIDANGVPGLGEGVRVDLSSCFLAGESAGGNIIHHLANRWAAAAPTPNSVRVAGLLSVQPYFGGEERTESELRLDGAVPIVTLQRADFWWRAFLPEGASRNHPAAHVTDENAELAEAFPPAMVLVGGLDPLQDWQRRYAEVLRGKGKAVEMVEFPDGIHAFYLFPDLPDTARAIERMRTFVESNRTSPSARQDPSRGDEID